MAKANEGVPDEEGWVTVTKYGKNKGAPRTEAHEKALTRKEKKRRKDKVYNTSATSAMFCVKLCLHTYVLPIAFPQTV